MPLVSVPFLAGVGARLLTVTVSLRVHKRAGTPFPRPLADGAPEVRLERVTPG